MQGKLRPQLKSEYITQGGSKFYQPAPGHPDLGSIFEAVMDKPEVYDILVDFLRAEGPEVLWDSDEYNPELTAIQQRLNVFWGGDDRSDAELLERASQSINGLSDLYYLTGFPAVDFSGGAGLGEYMPKTDLGPDPDLDFFKEHTDSIAYLSPSTHRYNTLDGPQEWVMDKELALKTMIHEGLLHGTKAAHPKMSGFGSFIQTFVGEIASVFGKKVDLFHQNYDTAVNEIFNTLSEDDKDTLYYYMFPDERIEPNATFEYTR